MLTGPQIEMPVRSCLHLAAPREIPVTIEVSSPEHMSEQKEQIGLRELSLDASHALCAQLSSLKERVAINLDCLLPHARPRLRFHRLPLRRRLSPRPPQ